MYTLKVLHDWFFLPFCKQFSEHFHKCNGNDTKLFLPFYGTKWEINLSPTTTTLQGKNMRVHAAGVKNAVHIYM